MAVDPLACICTQSYGQSLNDSLLKCAADKFHGIWDKAPAGADLPQDLLLLDLRPAEMESQLEKLTAAGMKLKQLFSYQWSAWTYYGAYLMTGKPERRLAASDAVTCCSSPQLAH
jgi:hypothetical protein